MKASPFRQLTIKVAGFFSTFFSNLFLESATIRMKGDEMGCLGKKLVIISCFIMLCASVSYAQRRSGGEMGSLIAVERVVEADCDDFSDDGFCSVTAMINSLNKLYLSIEYFDCLSMNKVLRLSVLDRYAKFTERDLGPCLMIEAKDLLCRIDPRTEFELVHSSEIFTKCSSLGSKCNVIWMPDYDQTIAFIGRLK